MALVRFPASATWRTKLSGSCRAAAAASYCGGGVSAAEAFMALRTAGIQTARVYDGSWTEWGADPATPKAPHSSG
jgi:thiosulfate/3-mercaptopyruvate sulfurtransferase